ncbi:MAG: ferritin-like domain-containing protein [bacterium]
MKIESLRDLYLHELGDMYSAEKQIVKALPKMVKAASSDDLKKALKGHLATTMKHVERLEKILGKGGASRTKKCKGMEGILEEGAEFLSEDCDPNVLDAGIIAAAQRVEHYEIAGYGTLCAYARVLDEAQNLKLLSASLQEENDSDRALSSIAEGCVNDLAAAAVEEVDESETSQAYTSR